MSNKKNQPDADRPEPPEAGGPGDGGKADTTIVTRRFARPTFDALVYPRFDENDEGEGTYEAVLRFVPHRGTASVETSFGYESSEEVFDAIANRIGGAQIDEMASGGLLRAVLVPG